VFAGRVITSRLSPRTPPGCDKQSGDKTPGIASLNPGLLSAQPFRLRSHAGGVRGM